MDENDALLGRTERDWSLTRAGTTCILRAAALIIKNGCFLAAKNEDHDCYYTVGGGIEINETSEEAVVREVYEETGYRLEIERLAYIQERFFAANSQRYHEIVFFYLMKTNENMNVENNNCTDHKKETLHWLPLDSLGEVNLVPEFLATKSFADITCIEHIVIRAES